MSASDDFDPTQKAWAFYVYLCGDNPQIAPHTRAQVEAIRSHGARGAFHVAVQWDLPEGARRALAAENGGWLYEEDLQRRNTGDPNELTNFLAWALDRAPATHAALILSGTGLLDERASVGDPDVDRTRIFTVLDDTTERDALELGSLGRALSRALAASSRTQFDVLAFDVSELQFLEVAYELDGLVDVLVAPQTHVPDQGWDFTTVLGAAADALANGTSSAVDLGRVLVNAAGASYQPHARGPLSVSAIDLRRLSDVASAFDTMSLAMIYAVGEELLWRARDRVFNYLRVVARPADGSSPGTTTPRAVNAWLYDIVEMLACFERELHESARLGLGIQLASFLVRQDSMTLLAALRSIDRACFSAAARSHLPDLQAVMADPPACRRELRRLIRALEAMVQRRTAHHRTVIDERVKALFTEIGVLPGRGSWLDDWPSGAIDLLMPALAAEYRVTERERHRVRLIARLAGRVVRLLVSSGDAPPAGATPLIVAHYVSMPPDLDRLLAGVSLFRPSQLDHLIASDYLQLEFNKRIHWTALLAVINLIGHHPRAIWRIVSGVLATADHATRSELLSRITGPDSVVGAFRQQFTVLAPLSALVLSLEPQAVASSGREGRRTAHTAPAAYRVRLEQAGREALIEETLSTVDPRVVEDVLERLVALMQTTAPAGPRTAREVESLGRTLGEDILQHLGHRLAHDAQSPAPGGVHLQLQIPRALMPYPWELMHHKGGWLSEHFALGRQLFTSGSAAPSRARASGPLRAVVIGNVTTTERGLPYGQQEAERVAAMFERLRDETDGLLEFDPRRDAHIGRSLTGLELRALLRDNRYDIIHFAGHATFKPDEPGQSAWMLSDGALTAQAIGNTLDWSDTEPWLVFANACSAGMDTAPRYQGESYGLAGAFLAQGVAAYIGPLWPIDDAVAAEMADVFYTKLLKDRQTVGEALRLARVAAKRKYYDPALAESASETASGNLVLLSWAGMVLYGNSTTTIGQRLGSPAYTEGPQRR